MGFLPHGALRCPLDQLALEKIDGSLRCAQGHSYDIARQGYVNLLGSQDKRSRDPGDSREMIAARRDFLESGHYAPVAARLCQLVESLLAGTPGDGPALIADAGCGEAYYLQQLKDYLAAKAPPAPSILGFDISKWAIQAAARRMPATWLVASNRQVPVADGCVDVLLCMFGFPDYPEFKRILRPGGALLLASAGPQHLIELREVIYPEVRHKEPARVTAAEAIGYSLLESSQLNYRLELAEQSAIDQLLCMTPHLFRASSEGKHKASELGGITLTVDVVFEVLRAT